MVTSKTNTARIHAIVGQNWVNRVMSGGMI